MTNPTHPQVFQYYDISPELSDQIAVFPGDTPFKRTIALSFAQDHNLLLSSIQTTVHLGAHTDAPNHYHPQGEGIASRSLHYYLGHCQVISVDLPTKPNQRILPLHIANTPIQSQRILFKTRSFPDPNRWNPDFVALSAELVHYLANQKVILVGIDAPSIDPSEDKVLESHQAVYQNNMAILEGIVLSAVPDGVYTLIALPLKLKDADASPVRAVLLPFSLKDDVVWKE